MVITGYIQFHHGGRFNAYKVAMCPIKGCQVTFHLDACVDDFLFAAPRKSSQPKEKDKQDEVTEANTGNTNKAAEKDTEGGTEKVKETKEESKPKK